MSILTRLQEAVIIILKLQKVLLYNVGTKHIEELHDLGYLPIRIKALPEGTLCPIWDT